MQRSPVTSALPEPGVVSAPKMPTGMEEAWRLLSRHLLGHLLTLALGAVGLVVASVILAARRRKRLRLVLSEILESETTVSYILYGSLALLLLSFIVIAIVNNWNA
jgi:hypothetical protein